MFSDATGTHGLPPDPDMPGFAEALAPSTFARQLDEQFRSAGVSVESCRLDRFRYRPGERLVVAYHVAAHDDRSGKARRLLVCGRIHAHRQSKLAGAQHRTGADLPRMVWLPGLGMRVEVFPWDRRMPALRDYAEPGSVARTELFAAWRQATQPPRESIEIEPVRYRPGIAATLHWRANDPATPTVEQHCFVKLQADGPTADRTDHFAGIETACKNAGVPLAFSAPVHRHEADGAALYRAARGQSLQSIMASPVPLTQAVALTARALATLHRLEAPWLPAADATRVIDELERATRLIGWACPEQVPLAECVLQRAQEVLMLPISGPTHGDMKADHIFLSSDDERVELIDSDALALANPLIDIGSLLARMRALPRLEGMSAARVHVATEQLREAYLDQVPREWRPLLPAAEAASTLLLCQHAIQRLVPNWRTFVATELEHTARAA